MKFMVLISAAFTAGQFWIVAENWLRRRRGRPALTRIASIDDVPVAEPLASPILANTTTACCFGPKCGMQARLLPMLAWYRALAESGFRSPLVPPFAMPVRLLQEGTLTAWAFAVPAIAIGFALNAIPLLSAAGWTLLAGVIISAVGHWSVAGPALPDFRQASGDARRVLKASR